MAGGKASYLKLLCKALKSNFQRMRLTGQKQFVLRAAILPYHIDTDSHMQLVVGAHPSDSAFVSNEKHDVFKNRTSVSHEFLGCTSN